MAKKKEIAKVQTGPPLPALFEGGPKGPIQGHHKPFHWVSWAFHQIRYKRCADKHYNPWLGKHLKVCQRITNAAMGDLEEVKRRMSHLWEWCKFNEDFYHFTPECLLNRWDDMHFAPSDARGGRHVLRQQAEQVGRQRAREAIETKYGRRAER